MSYYNTTSESGTALAEHQATAKKQDTEILKVFRRNPEKPLAASNVFQLLGGLILITSVRRSLNTLEKQGKIYKTGKKQKSPWDRPENLYLGKFEQGKLF